MVHSLYELLCNNCVQIIVRDPLRGRACSRSIFPGTRCSRWDSRRTRECCPIPGVPSWATGLLQEYFCFPQKFFFVDLTGLQDASARRASEARRSDPADLAI